MGECSRCGECCRYMPLGQWSNVNQVIRHYLDVRATQIEGTYVIKAPCKYLIEPTEDDLANGINKCKCGVEGYKPELCRMFRGNRTEGKFSFWIPPGCTMAKK